MCPWVGEKPGSPWVRAVEITDAMQDPKLRSAADWTAGSVCALRRDWGCGVETARRGLDRSPERR